MESHSTQLTLAGPFAVGLALRQARAEIPVIPVGDPADVEAEPGGYVVRGLARVLARPHRRDDAARRLAARIALRPSTYLSLCLSMNVPGVADLRPSFGKGAANG